MNLGDTDLELFLQIYDKAIKYVPLKVKSDFAEDFVFTLDDYGIDLKRNAVELSEHCDYLDEAITDFFEENDDYDSDEEYADEYWEEED